MLPRIPRLAPPSFAPTEVDLSLTTLAPQSNHGGRQADYAPAPIDVLYEIRCYRPDLFAKTEIMIDGGIRTGADVVKALALGAKAVGIGRPILYANGTHGEQGVRRVLESESATRDDNASMSMSPQMVRR